MSSSVKMFEFSGNILVNFFILLIVATPENVFLTNNATSYGVILSARRLFMKSSRLHAMRGVGCQREHVNMICLTWYSYMASEIWLAWLSRINKTGFRRFCMIGKVAKPIQNKIFINPSTIKTFRNSSC